MPQQDPLVEAMLRRTPNAPEPDIDLARAHMETQMPEEMKNVRSIKPMGWWDPARQDPATVAVTDIFNNIRYNPKSLKRWSDGDQSRMDDLLAHELTHVRQHMRYPGLIQRIFAAFKDNADNEYMDRSGEKEAFGTMEKRMSKRRDISLDPPKTGN